MKIDPELKTKLWHIDVQHHWLQQEVQNQHLRITWQEMAKMPVDGLMKALLHKKHQEFMEILSLVDIGDRI